MSIQEKKIEIKVNQLNVFTAIHPSLFEEEEKTVIYPADLFGKSSSHHSNRLNTSDIGSECELCTINGNNWSGRCAAATNTSHSSRHFDGQANRETMVDALTQPKPIAIALKIRHCEYRVLLICKMNSENIGRTKPR